MQDVIKPTNAKCNHVFAKCNNPAVKCTAKWNKVNCYHLLDSMPSFNLHYSPSHYKIMLSRAVSNFHLRNWRHFFGVRIRLRTILVRFSIIYLGG